MKIQIRTSPDHPRSTATLSPCDNRRDHTGMPTPRPDDCLAHFDARANPTPGLANSPHPNSVHSWVEHLATTPIAQDTMTSSPRAESTHTAVIHDGNGTWFTPGGLWLSALTPEELDRLEAGSEHVLDELGAINLVDLIPAALVGETFLNWE